jgi:spore maturation protein CgeB
LASGGFHLTGYVPGLETMFDNDRNLVWFRSDEECIDLIAYYLDRPAERARIAAEGQRHVRERYPLAGQVRTLLAYLDELHVAS